jgi:hypothetical protein
LSGFADIFSPARPRGDVARNLERIWLLMFGAILTESEALEGTLGLGRVRIDAEYRVVYGTLETIEYVVVTGIQRINA